ncbi:MAG TPA: helix-turn-helix domain-containing protein [Solirubrobacteraceae bacterium]
MPDIGATLREARMRARTDIAEIEEQTKIRAKYLRALENEEWDLLPGPTFVKSFLRTYADALGLDGKLLVEEYKLRHERPSDVELQPIAPPGARDVRGPSRMGRGWAIAGLAIVLVGAFYLLGKGSGGNGKSRPNTIAATTTTSQHRRTAGRGAAASQRTAPRKPRQARLKVTATGPVYVCVKSAGRTLVAGETLTAGASRGTFRGKRFTVVLGNASATLRVNGKGIPVGASSNAIAFVITPKGARRVTPNASIDCA